MKKENFTIEGSIPLKEAFVKESGIKFLDGKQYIKDFKFLGPCYESQNKGMLQGVNSKKSKYFKLPQQWNEALEYIKYYFEEPEFKVGDWVYWSGVNPRIGKLECRCTSLPGSSWKPVEGDYSWNEMHLRLLTQEEILEHLQKEFTERTGIDVGSCCSRLDVTDRDLVVTGFKLLERGVNTGKMSWLNDEWFNRNPQDNFQLGVELNQGICSPDGLKLAKPKLTFGGSDVTLEKVSSGVRIHCGGGEGTLSQMEKIYNLFSPFKSYPKFGSTEVKRVEYEEGEWTQEGDKENVVGITIGCTTGTWKEFMSVLKEARKLN